MSHTESFYCRTVLQWGLLRVSLSLLGSCRVTRGWRRKSQGRRWRRYCLVYRLIYASFQGCHIPILLAKPRLWLTVYFSNTWSYCFPLALALPQHHPYPIWLFTVFMSLVFFTYDLFKMLTALLKHTFENGVEKGEPVRWRKFKQMSLVLMTLVTNDINTVHWVKLDTDCVHGMQGAVSNNRVGCFVSKH